MAQYYFAIDLDYGAMCGPLFLEDLQAFLRDQGYAEKKDGYWEKTITYIDGRKGKTSLYVISSDEMHTSRRHARLSLTLLPTLESCMK